MRIGLVIYGTLDTVTGGYIYDRKLVTRLRDIGDEVHIVSLPARNYARQLLYNFATAIVQKISRLKFDVLLEDELNHPSCIILNQKLRSKNRCPIISIVHHLRADENKRTGYLLQVWIEKKYLQSVDGFVFNSHATASSVGRFVGNKPSVVAHPGKDRLPSNITHQEIAERSKRSAKLEIVFLGNVTPRKGLTELICALCNIPRDEWNLTVIGSTVRDPSYCRAVIELIRNNGLEKNIILTGQIPDAEVTRHLRKNHVLAVPSFYEGFGLAYIEAMGSGLPVIGAITGGAREIVEHGRNGFLSDPRNTEELTGFLKTLNKDRAMLRRMSINALNTYHVFSNWDDTAKKIREFLLRKIIPLAGSNAQCRTQ